MSLPMLCIAGDCEKPKIAQGYCPTHYAAARRTGKIGLRHKHPRRDNRERVFALIDSSGGAEACWPWLGARDRRGYGRTYLMEGPLRREMAAHRAAYTLAKGEIPDGLYILHACDNPPCCNPAHLRPGTPQENMDDRHRSGLRKPKGTWLPQAPDIPAHVVEAIRADYQPWVKGHTCRAVAARYGVHRDTVLDIHHRRGRWVDQA